MDRVMGSNVTGDLCETASAVREIPARMEAADRIINMMVGISSDVGRMLAREALGSTEYVQTTVAIEDVLGELEGRRIQQLKEDESLDVRSFAVGALWGLSLLTSAFRRQKDSDQERANDYERRSSLRETIHTLMAARPRGMTINKLSHLFVDPHVERPQWNRRDVERCVEDLIGEGKITADQWRTAFEEE